MKENYYQATTGYPAHLSVGAVLLNGKDEVCSLHFDTISVPEYSHLEDFYILMRETVEMGETLEQAVLRGIKEEFGAEGTVLAYLGSRKTTFVRRGVSVEKTTVFFILRCTGFDIEDRELEGAEAESTVVWMPITELKAKMKAQYERFREEDINEAEMLERAEAYLVRNRP